MLAIGLVSVAAQVLVPYAAHLAPPEHRGRMVGNVMSGLMIGIMLARPRGLWPSPEHGRIAVAERTR